jgi:hypothetical protein
MAIREDVRVQVPPAEPRHRRCSAPVVDSLAVVAVAAPFFVVGLVFLFTHDHVLGGDQALIALDAFDVRHLDQAVGPYSRMGWAHPGPAWLILLAPLYWLFGSTGEALVAASMIIHGVIAALVVVAAGTGRSWQRPLMAAVVLLYVLRMPAIEFVNLWNPFALLLPVMLLLVLAARACAGSVPAFATSLIVASFVVQTHVGTAPLVGLVGLTMVVALGIRLRRSELSLTRQIRARAGLAAVVTVLMWVPPLWQQLTAPAGRGNLRMLAGFLVHGGNEEGTHTWREAVSAVGQLLGSPVYGWPALPEPMDTTILTPAVIAAVVVQLLGGVGVAVVGRRMHAGLAAWLGLVAAVGTLAALVSARTVTGPLHNYLVLWISVLPAVLLFAGLALLADWVRRVPVRVSVAATAGLAGAAIVLSAGVGASLQRAATTQMGNHPGAAEASELVLGALPAPEDEDVRVLLDIREASAWATATAVALQLEQAGFPVSVREKWVYGFGSDRASAGDEGWRVSFIPAKPEDAPRDGQLGVVGGMNGLEAIVLQERERR